MTKAATMDTRRVVTMLLLAAMLIAMIPIGVAVFPYSVLADNTSTVTGNFTVNNGAPIVDNVTLHLDGGGAATSMNPYTDNYEVWVHVTEDGTFATITTITVTLYYDDNGTYVESEAQSQSGNNNTCAIITYTNDSPDTWVLSSGSGTTWAEYDGTTPGDGATQGYFVFDFRAGKVAQETADPSDDAEWMIYAVASDAALSGDNHAEDLEMNWYGEITNVDTTTTFGSVNLGAAASVSSAIDATYISNGAFDEQVQTEATWDGNVALDLDPDGSPESGDFSLQADDDTGVPAASWVTTSYTSFAIDDTANDTFTAETGHVTAAYLFLTLANAGIPPDTYTGTVWLAITNATS